METQLKSSRVKQKNNARGQSKLPSSVICTKEVSGPTTKSDHSRRLFVSSNKRPIARFAKGPTEATGFLYPRRRAASLCEIYEESSPLLSLEKSHSSSAFPLQQNYINSSATSESTPIVCEEALLEQTNLSEHGLENIGLEACEKTAPILDTEETAPILDSEDTEETAPVAEETASVCEEIASVEQATQTVNLHSRVELGASIKTKNELPDDTVGPDDSQSSESESSEEESEVEIVKPIPLPVVSKPVIKLTPPLVVRKVTIPAVLPTHRKVVPVASQSRSSWSKFLPLVIEIKATIPYPTHLLAVAMFLVVALILGLSYQFGADLGSGSDLQGQIFRLLKLALLFAVVAVCVNFVEDNKELPQTDVVPSHQPKLRGKANKNKKKMMKA